MRLEIFNKPGFGRRLRRLLTGEPQPMATRNPVNSAPYVPPVVEPLPEQPEPESKTDHETVVTPTEETQP